MNVAVYLRADKLIVVPQGGGGGYYFDIEPVRVVSPDVTSANEAVAEALDASAQCKIAQPPEGYRSPALAAAGARSWKAFYRGAAHCFLYSDGASLYVQKWAPASDGRGFEPSTEPPALITDKQAAGEAVLKCLSTARPAA